MQTAAGEVEGKIQSLAPAPVYHGGQGVVESVEGGDIVPLPASVPQRAAAAHPARRPVEDGGGVAVVGTGPAEGAAQGGVELLKGSGGLQELAAHIGHGPVRRVGRPLAGQQGPHPAGELVRQQQEEHRGGEHFVQQGQAEARLPAPQHRDGVGQDIGHGGQEPALSAEHARHQPRQAEGDGAGPGSPHGDIHAQPGGHPGGSPDLQPPLGGDHHYAQGGGDAAQGDQVPQNGELG